MPEYFFGIFDGMDNTVVIVFALLAGAGVLSSLLMAHLLARMAARRPVREEAPDDLADAPVKS